MEVLFFFLDQVWVFASLYIALAPLYTYNQQLGEIRLIFKVL
jgi:hypothetical protein